ncbi:hypothetical protein COCCADRAFT_39111 [Bipolaris zeicola 26-R-13]|uniref:P-loop containing nucleoside triphosphate hydrolase protein n=1 Tax=Cochliobolus carbonum (strain 26-R-13) TaxID=930089 RepID=W6XZH7_COCC2|nr:uncharacterized protein COCCADRAFT_39111 [Bipolaris zeicola 26-R-13]EUC30675.1 hypothetical protein COCCADRAFT_39111 [Bipolaris zeicola 26-R-13]
MLRSKKSESLRIVVLGHSQVGKTCFVDMFLEGTHFISHSAISSMPLSRRISHSGASFTLSFIDLDLTGPIASSYRTIVDEYLRLADGIVLLYDITCSLSFASVTHEFYVHAWTCRDDISTKEVNGHVTKKRFGCVLVGNKRDVIVGEDASKRQVDKNMAEQWASSQGSKHFEITASERGEVEEVVKALVDSIARARRTDQRDKANGATEDKGSVLRLFKRSA